MLDPLTAISLASAIVQFVDFGSKLFIEGYGAYRSEPGATEESQDVQKATERLHELANRLSIPRRVWKTSEELALWELAAEAQQVAEQLLDLLAECKISSTGLARTWEAVRKTTKRHVKAEKYAGLQSRLDRIQRDISLHLLAILRDDQTAVRQSLRSLEVASEKLHTQNMDRIESRTRELKLVLEGQGSSMQALLLSSTLTAEAQAAAAQRFEASLQNLDAKLTALQQEGAAVTTSQRILDSLVFTEMHQRQRDIHKEYPNTFSWMFDDDRTPFKRWLLSSSGVFWVSGKAGSGKSTLMKYVTESDQTTTILTQWVASQRKDLVVGSFYFWNAGSGTQNSQEGLLQSLVYQTFLQCPDMIPHATTKKRWNAPDSPHASLRPWDLEELCETIENIARHGQKLSKCFCFFVDGLDEYSGDLLSTLTSLFEKLTASDCVKMYLTVGDMDKYISGMLEKDSKFQRLAQRSPGAWDLVKTIRERAEGVFLWVYLVVRRLLRLLEEKIRELAMLQAALDELPSDLEEYFRHIVDTIEPAHRRHTAGIFSLALYAAPLPLIAFWFLSQILDRPEIVLSEIKDDNDGDDDDDDQDTDDRSLVNRTKETINSWCKDLLEVRRTKDEPSAENERDYQIDFLHRTVRDFLTTNLEVKGIFTNNLPTKFDAGDTLVRLYLVQAMMVDARSGHQRDLKVFATIVSDLMMVARRCELEKRPIDPRLLTRLDCIGSEVMRSSGPTSHWLNTCPHVLQETSPGYDVASVGFMAVAVAFESMLFVTDQTASSPSMTTGRSGAVLLDVALNPMPINRALPADRLPCYDMLVLLLGKNADPNAQLMADADVSTPWQRFLERCRTDPGQGPKLWPYAKLLLKLGADPDAQVVIGTKLVQRIRKNARHAAVPNTIPIEQCLLNILLSRKLAMRKFAKQRRRRHLSGVDKSRS